MHYVYKFVKNNEILYIGKSNAKGFERIKAHGKSGDNIPEKYHNEINQADIYYAELPSSIMTDVVESELIRRYKPRYNKAKTSDWSGLEFVEPKWITYRKNNEIVRPIIKKQNKKKKIPIEKSKTETTTQTPVRTKPKNTNSSLSKSICNLYITLGDEIAHDVDNRRKMYECAESYVRMINEYPELHDEETRVKAAIDRINSLEFYERSKEIHELFIKLTNGVDKESEEYQKQVRLALTKLHEIRNEIMGG